MVDGQVVGLDALEVGPVGEDEAQAGVASGAEVAPDGLTVVGWE
jgi:hypothetical protein